MRHEHIMLFQQLMLNTQYPPKMPNFSNRNTSNMALIKPKWFKGLSEKLNAIQQSETNMYHHDNSVNFPELLIFCVIFTVKHDLQMYLPRGKTQGLPVISPNPEQGTPVLPVITTSLPCGLFAAAMMLPVRFELSTKGS